MFVVCPCAGAAAESDGSPHWSYDGPEGVEHWGMVSPAYMACESGSHQSPINITMAEHTGTQEQLVFRYQSAALHAVDNGHTIQVAVPLGSELQMNGQTYNLRQFHFHGPSEHHVAGRTFPMELHLVHQDGKGYILVVAVLIEVGVSNRALVDLWQKLPSHAGEQGPTHPLKPHDLLLASLHHFSYQGSLTTPPCTEGVQWIVLRDPSTLSSQQVAQFVLIVGRNVRPVQPFHERQVSEE